jgi:hypothetical protein
MDNGRHLRRYTDLPALIYLLSERKLTLLDPRSWDDRNDSNYLSVYRRKKNLKSVLALCFTQASETYHHWRVFSSGSSGACIRFKRSELLKTMNAHPGIRSNIVQYLTLDKMREKKRNKKLAVNDLPFLKRYAYGHEEEFRIIYESKATKLRTLDIDILLSSIDTITLSPWISEALSANVKRTLKSIQGCSKLRIVRSTLISNEEWKKFAETAL